MLRTDNRTVEAVLKNKNTADMFLADAMRWICMLAHKKRIRFYIKYIWTKENKLHDALSSFDAKKAIEEARKLDFQIFTASPDSMEDADVVYPILGGRKDDRIVVIPRMAIKQAIEIDEEE